MRYFLFSKSSACSPELFWIMRHFLPLSKASILKINPWRAVARSFASESAVHCNEGSDKIFTLGQRWQEHENQILIEGMKKQQQQLEKVGRSNVEQSSKEKWEEIEMFCYSRGVNRTAEQCRDRWKRLLHAFFKIKSWESSVPPGKTSFWSMKASERKLQGLPFSLDRKIFYELDEIQNKKESWYNSASFPSVKGGSTNSPSSSTKLFELETLSLDLESDAPVTKQSMHMHQQSKRVISETHDQQETNNLQQCINETALSMSSNINMQALEDKSSAVPGRSAQQGHVRENDDRSPLLVGFIHQSIVDLAVAGLEYDPNHPSEAQPDPSRGTSNKSHGSNEL